MIVSKKAILSDIKILPRSISFGLLKAIPDKDLFKKITLRQYQCDLTSHFHQILNKLL